MREPIARGEQHRPSLTAPERRPTSARCGSSQLIKEATVDAYDDEEQATGWFTMLASLDRAIRKFVEHNHAWRNHQGLDNRLIPADSMPAEGDVVGDERLGGLLMFRTVLVIAARVMLTRRDGLPI